MRNIRKVTYFEHSYEFKRHTSLTLCVTESFLTIVFAVFHQSSRWMDEIINCDFGKLNMFFLKSSFASFKGKIGRTHLTCFESYSRFFYLVTSSIKKPVILGYYTTFLRGHEGILAPRRWYCELH